MRNMKMRIDWNVDKTQFAYFLFYSFPVYHFNMTDISTWLAFIDLRHVENYIYTMAV